MQDLKCMMRSVDVGIFSPDVKESDRCYSPKRFQKSTSNIDFGNFKRNFNQRRKRSEEVEAILAKYAHLKKGNATTCTSTASFDKRPINRYTMTSEEDYINYIKSASTEALPHINELPSTSHHQRPVSFFERIPPLTSMNFGAFSALRNAYSNNIVKNDPCNEKHATSVADLRQRYSHFKYNTDRNSFCGEMSHKSNTIRSMHFKEESIFVENPVMDEPKSFSFADSVSGKVGGDYNYRKVISVPVKNSKQLKNGEKRWWRSQVRMKDMFECWIKWKRRKVDSSNAEKIQGIDDGFFEKFGSILRQHSVKAALKESTPLAALFDEPLPETITEESASQLDTDATAPRIAPRFGEADTLENDAVTDVDSESNDSTKIELFEEIVSLNIDELYKEILYEILHNVGCDVSVEIGQLSLLSYIQDAFKIASDKHQELLADAEAKEPPEILLNVEIIEAKDLLPKDPNGLSDPFVTMYLMSNKTQRYNTSVKLKNLNPVWEEHFSLPIAKDPNEDTLCLEIWDLDPAESMKEKMGKIFEVKGVRGLRKLMKEIAVTASTGKHDNELIGKAHIPLKTIPASGMVMWYSLDKKTKTKRGVVKVHLKFSSEKNVQVATQEHRHLLRILLMHELENSKVAPYWWAGNFGAQAEAIITQHGAQSGLNQNSLNLIQWTVFCTVHTEHGLSFSLFANILNKLTKPLQSNLFSEDDNKLFWDGVRKLLPSCYSTVRKIRKKNSGDKHVLKLIKEILTLLCNLNEMKVAEEVNLFPDNHYGWLPADRSNYCIKDVLDLAINQGASEWFDDIVENNDSNDKSEEGKLQFLIRIIQLLRSDLQRAIEYYDKCFAETIGVSYSQTLYMLYEKKLSELAEPIVLDVCKCLKRLRYSSDNSTHITLASELGQGIELGGPVIKNEPLAMGTTLFELYLILQRLLKLGQGLCPVDWSNLSIAKFHTWFFGGVAQWLDIAVFKALTRIEKAVELDKLVEENSTEKYSSSAVDTLQIFYQIKVFWEQLDWPDAEGSYTFVAKIVDDICRCCVFYADKMAARVDGMGEVTTVYENKFHVTTEWCLAVNNIDYVSRNLKSFAIELGMKKIIDELSELRSPVEAERCKDTLDNVVENSIDTIRNKIIELLEIVVKKMMPSISRFLLEGAELLHQDCSSMERVMMYLDENLSTLHSNFSADNFTRTLDVVWYQLSDLLLNLVQTNLEKRRPPSFFSNLNECLNIMVKSFKQDNTDSQCSETLKKVEYLLKLHGFETADLIHQFFIERWQEQQTLNESSFGVLAVRAAFCDSAIKIELINARNLLPMDSNGSVDSFVRINILPENIFAGTVRPKTQTHNKTLFPLYDETFTIILTPEQRNYTNGMIMFNIKDYDMFSLSNQYLAEAFLHFKDIPETDDIRTLPQVHLMLSRPTKLDGEAIKSLEHRQGDKQAKEFLKKQKQKIGLPH